jgi:hypothetical protein
MKKLVSKHDEEMYPQDIDRIVEVCKANGYEIDRATAQLAWKDVSDMMCAGWLGLPESDEELMRDIMYVLKVEENENESTDS